MPVVILGVHSSPVDGHQSFFGLSPLRRASSRLLSVDFVAIVPSIPFRTEQTQSLGYRVRGVVLTHIDSINSPRSLLKLVRARVVLKRQLGRLIGRLPGGSCCSQPHFQISASSDMQSVERLQRGQACRRKLAAQLLYGEPILDE